MSKLQALIDKKGDSAQFMCDEIAHICKTMPKRPPGSDGEEMACKYMADTMENLGAKAQMESFKENPNAFFGFLYFTVTLALLGIASFFVLPVLGVVLIALGFLILVLQFGFYKKIVDVFFKKATGHNVTAVLPCKGEVKGRVFFNGHPDAVWYWPYHHHMGSQMNLSIQVLAILGALIWFALDIAAAVKVGGGAIYGYNFDGLQAAYGLPLVCLAIVCLFFAVPLTMLYFMWDERKITDGANDNLTGCYIGIAIMKAMKDAGIELEHTEVGVIISGSEEAGLRGSMAWAKAHKDDFKDVPTYIYSFDTINESKYLGVNYRDLNGTVKSDKEVCDSFMQAAEELGIACQRTWVPPLGGATDNAAFNKGGFKSAGITAMNHVLPDYYHTLRDTPENLNPECLADCFAISVKCLENFDRAVSGENAD